MIQIHQGFWLQFIYKIIRIAPYLEKLKGKVWLKPQNQSF